MSQEIKIKIPYSLEECLNKIDNDEGKFDHWASLFLYENLGEFKNEEDYEINKILHETCDCDSLIDFISFLMENLINE